MPTETTISANASPVAAIPLEASAMKYGGSEPSILDRIAAVISNVIKSVVGFFKSIFTREETLAQPKTAGGDTTRPVQQPSSPEITPARTTSMEPAHKDSNLKPVALKMIDGVMEKSSIKLNDEQRNDAAETIISIIRNPDKKASLLSDPKKFAEEMANELLNPTSGTPAAIRTAAVIHSKAQEKAGSFEATDDRIINGIPFFQTGLKDAIHAQLTEANIVAVNVAMARDSSDRNPPSKDISSNSNAPLISAYKQPANDTQLNK